MDIDENGNGVVKGYRLYQLIRQKGKVEDRTFEIQFLDLAFRLSRSRLVRIYRGEGHGKTNYHGLGIFEGF